MPYADPARAKEYWRVYGKAWEAAHRTERNERTRLRAARTRAEFFEGKSCVRCGSVDRLELDHIDASTKVSSNIWSWSPAKREAEIAKCQVLCRPHHIEKTVENLEHPHGSRSNLAVWTEEDVLEVRRLFAEGVPQTEIGRRLGMNKGTVWNIVHRKSWMHL